ncbi:uncharacterized protein TNCV_643911 [Trichonephila clavipes]|nr:uncharacterized protein TNCV_643911 [Trichonephila clavipes]
MKSHGIPSSPRAAAVAKFRLLTGHDCLCAHLFHFNLVTSPICVLCDTGQDMTAAHLDECSALNDINCIVKRKLSPNPIGYLKITSLQGHFLDEAKRLDSSCEKIPDTSLFGWIRATPLKVLDLREKCIFDHAMFTDSTQFLVISSCLLVKLVLAMYLVSLLIKVLTPRMRLFYLTVSIKGGATIKGEKEGSQQHGGAREHGRMSGIVVITLARIETK